VAVRYQEPSASVYRIVDTVSSNQTAYTINDLADGWGNKFF
jgi:uncharacterized membrane protein